jgi:aquaporin Z
MSYNLTIWQRLNWAEYIAEVLGTTLVVFIGLSTAVFNFAEGLPIEQLVPDKGIRLLMTGVVFAGSGSLVAISPLGKLSGAHINPVVSLAFWIQGKMNLIDFFGYIIGQFCGGIIGAWLLVTVWGKYATSIDNGMTLPGTDYSLLSVFSAEVYMTFLLVFLISLFLSNSRLMRWTPLMTWVLMATMVWLGSPISGTSVNPARSFGPALVTWFWQDHWIYWVGPILGSLIAVMAFQVLSMGKRSILTAKLFHVPHYRCIFKNIKAPHLQDGRIYSKI